MVSQANKYNMRQPNVKSTVTIVYVIASAATSPPHTVQSERMNWFISLPRQSLPGCVSCGLPHAVGAASEQS